jgi:hypothetical protein
MANTRKHKRTIMIPRTIERISLIVNNVQSIVTTITSI